MSAPVPSTLDSSLLDRHKALILAFTFVPVFFQLDATLFTDPQSLTLPRGAVTNLPIPISLIACGLTVLLLVRTWAVDRLALLLLTCLPLMLLASIVAGDGGMTWTKAKLLVFQFGVPLAGFIVGRQLTSVPGTERRIGRILLAVSVLCMSAHLLSSWSISRLWVLAPEIFGLGVYGHLQYVPPVQIATFLAGFFAVWEPHAAPGFRRLASIGILVAATYAAASMSLTAVLGLWLGVGAFSVSAAAAGRRLHGSLLLSITVVISVGYVVVATSRVPAFQAKFLGLDERALPTREQAGRRAAAPAGESVQVSGIDTADEIEEVKEEVRPLANVTERAIYWRYFSEASTSSPGAFLFGHAHAPDIRTYPSAHNYYLDFLYNFGALAMLPLIAVITITARRVWLARAELMTSPALCGLLVAAILLLVVDNSLKVGMRQLYPGIATFLIWGMLATASQHARASVPSPKSLNDVSPAVLS